jgi:photosystem II stability/assembly factor-like uncharacterized protein
VNYVIVYLENRKVTDYSETQLNYNSHQQSDLNGIRIVETKHMQVKSTLKMITGFLLLLATFIAYCGPAHLSAQTDSELIDQLQYRCIGPFRGGRSAAATGVTGNPMLYYFGACGGGVWKTDDAGSTWENISDGFFGGSIGAVTVAPSDNNVIYVGGGEITVRGNVSHGDGVWKSTDAGKTWTHGGLSDTQTIGRIRVHPDDPETVYVAALGHLYGPNQQRGVFRSTDGGKNWQRILFVNDEVGAADLVIDPNNSRVLYATTWKVKRTPYSLESGGEGSGIWKSVDGGDTWSDITRNAGLPKGVIGICGIDVSPVDSNRVWAIVEAAEGGVFRSDNAGETWTRINQDRNLRQRAWYYSRIYAGPQSIDEVYVLNVSFWRSNDGGKNFNSISTPHGDHHDLWINPDRPDCMIIADDGGAQITFNRGRTWSTYMNQPTAQFYRVITDDHFPYRVYGAQQDNSTVRILSQSDSRSIGESDWQSTAGGESGHLAVDPTNNEIVYGGSYGGFLTRINHQTGEQRNVHVWPDDPLGHGAGDLKYRFQWNFPIFYSPHDKKCLYSAANVLFKTTDGGETWTQISPDLTRNDPSKLGPSGGPITKDNTSIEYYCTIFAAAESIHEPGVLWTGSDDGLVHLSVDAGQNWSNVTPPTLPEWAQINSIEIHPTEKGGLYLAATRYKLDDFKPYLFKTLDYGKTWEQINDGIERDHFTRVVRADPNRAGLLYAGTERGIYVSFDDGKKWQPMQANLPIVPITDMTIKNNQLVVATQGRSFWILDDLALLHQWKDNLGNKSFHLFSPDKAYRTPGRGGRASLLNGTNPSGGVSFDIIVNQLPDQAEATLEIFDANTALVRKYSTKPDTKLNEVALNLKKGFNRINWNMRYPNAETFDGMVIWGGGTQGPEAVPGNYSATLTLADQTQTVEFEILKDPRVSASIDDLQQQFKLLIEIRDLLSKTHQTIKTIRDVRSQITAIKKRLAENAEHDDLVKQADAIIHQLTTIEEKLYQTKNQSSQDPLNFPIRLNNRLSALVGVVGMGDNRPTRQSYEVRDELAGEINAEIQAVDNIIQNDIAALNNAIHAKKIPAIFVD